MGFVLDVDLETSQGPSHEVYVRVESFSFNKVTSYMQFQITYWLNRDAAIRFNREYLDQETRNAKGLIQERLIYFENPNDNGKDLILPHHMKVPVVRVEEVDEPIFETVTKEIEVPYVSFDAEGNEVTKYRVIHKEEKAQTGSIKKVKEVIDTAQLSDTLGFCYGKIKEMLSEFIPESKILTVK